jgi:small subunit ribosomal protein S12
MTTINQFTRKLKIKNKPHKDTPALKSCPQVRGTVMRARIVTPRKPNSARRPVAKVVLSNGKRVTAHIPGVGHNLRRFSQVLVRGGGARDLPGVRYSCVRGVHDCLGLVHKKRRRSIYGAPMTKRVRRARRKFRIR